MKVFSATQIRAWDQYTIENEPIASANLMRRAAKVFFDWFTQCYSDTRQPILIIAGTGNNGGDGIAVARLLDMAQYTAKVIVCDFGTRHSPDFDLQLAEFPTNSAVECRICTSVTAFESAFNDFSGSEPVVIDALFGTGLNKVLSGDWLKVVEHINRAALEIASIDVPTGLLADEHTPGNAVIKAARTFTFQAPKKAFFFAENAERVGEWSVGDIGLHAAFSELTPTLVHFFTADDARHLFKPRKKFAHKGTFGHALLICGSYGKMGAAVLSARACLRSGAGLVTVHAPRSGNIILQTAVPEAMFQADKAEEVWTTVPEKINYQAVGIGPGIGRAPETALAMAATLAQFRQPLVLDADALNLISEHPEILNSVPPHSILTPHPKEFERLFGASANDFERSRLQCDMAQKYQVVIVLKGAHTAVALPDGQCWFNSSGNPGMATAGSGDVLTGIITGLLAQGYAPEHAALLGVWLHGRAADLAVESSGRNHLIASDLINNFHVSL